MINYFAGIGSRETPLKVQNMMGNTAKFLASKGWILNSGGADGADDAFERLCPLQNRQIFLPWDGFNGKYIKPPHYIVPPYNEDLARYYHPKFSALKENGRLLMSRNSYQVLGADLQTPVKFVLCWTQNGAMKGGTAQAMRIAVDHEIPIFNYYNDLEKLKHFLENYI